MALLKVLGNAVNTQPATCTLGQQSVRMDQRFAGRGLVPRVSEQLVCPQQFQRGVSLTECKTTFLQGTGRVQTLHHHHLSALQGRPLLSTLKILIQFSLHVHCKKMLLQK